MAVAVGVWVALVVAVVVAVEVWVALVVAVAVWVAEDILNPKANEPLPLPAESALAITI